MVRHGETEENVAEIIQGQIHGRLTKRGLEQVRKLALRLKDEEIDVIFSSDLLRAKITALEIAKYHKQTPLYYSADFRERSYGVFEGKPVRYYLKVREAKGGSRESFVPEGGESFVQVMERANKVLNKIFKDYKGRCVLVVAHGGFNKALLGVLLKLPPSEAINLEQANACINIIQVADNAQHKVHVINSIEHL